MSIRIFVGTPGNNEDLECQCVLNWSLRKHHPGDDLDIIWMMLSRDPESFWYSDPQANPRKGWNTKDWATPFSALRWGIPAACNFEGRAIYIDSDTIPVADIKELWDQPLRGNAAVISKENSERFCVSLFDCERMRDLLPPIQKLKSDSTAYRSIRKSIDRYVQPFVGDWNCVDGDNYKDLNDPEIKILHYSAIPTQPNHRHARARLKQEGKTHWFAGPDKPHPRKEISKLFDDILEEATAAGFGPETFRVSPEFGDYGRGR